MDVFARGVNPVGVQTRTLVDLSRNRRSLAVEIWYPAADEARGRDLDPGSRDEYDLIPGLRKVWQEAARDAPPRNGRFPLVVFSHGFGGHRRQSTYLTTHLASHGYVVAAVDHTGNTLLDTLELVASLQSGSVLSNPGELVAGFVANRPADVTFAIDRLLAGEIDGFAERIDPDRIGMSGHSFGGWTTLAVAGRDSRIRAILPLAPAGGSSPLGDPGALRAEIAPDWGRPVPMLVLAADGDSLLPLPGVRELYESLPEPKRLVVLRNADHMHFCDRVEQAHEMFRGFPPPGFEGPARAARPASELVPGEVAYRFGRGLALAHFDAHLKTAAEARSFLEGDVAAALTERGIDAWIPT